MNEETTNPKEPVSAAQLLEGFLSLRENLAFQTYMEELNRKFNELYVEYVRDGLDPVEVVRKMEKQKGVAYAIRIFDSLIQTLKEDARFEEEQKELERGE